jgi:peptide/nickel transport system permease protein
VLTRALPGDPTAYFAGPKANAESIEETHRVLGLDKPLIQQFGLYVGDLLQGDLGQSVPNGQPVATERAQRLPASLELTLSALMLSCAIAIPLGGLAATRAGSWVDHLCRVLVTAGVAPSPLVRLDFVYLPPPHVTGFYLIDAALAGDWATWWWGAQAAGSAGDHARALHAGADRPDDPRRDAPVTLGRTTSARRGGPP